MSLEKLRNELKKGSLGYLYAFYGPEEYLKRAYLKRCIRLLFGKGSDRMDLHVFEGKVEPAAVEEAVYTFPFLHEKKLVLLKQTGFLKKAGPFAELLERIIADPPAYLVLIFVEPGDQEINRSVKAWKLMEKHGLSVRFDFQPPKELADWVVGILGNRRVNISVPDALYLVRLCDAGMWELDSETGKLAAYAGPGGTVGRETIDRICIPSLEHTVFEITDAMTAGKAENALTYLHRLLERKEPAQRILFMLARHFRQLYLASLLADSGVRRDEIGKRLGFSSPFVTGKVVDAVSRYREAGKAKAQCVAAAGEVDFPEILERALRTCREYDIAVKNSLLNGTVAAELLISEYSVAFGPE